MLTPPSLRRLAVEIDSLRNDPSQRGLSLAKTALEKCPDLDTLDIDTSLHNYPPLGFVKQFPPAHALRTLRVHAGLVGHDLLGWSSSLPLLQRLYFYGEAHDWIVLKDNFRPLRPYVFNTLTHLTLRLDTVLDPAIMLWETCEYPLLEDLTINFGTAPFDDPRVHPFAARVARQNPQIKMLRVDFGWLVFDEDHLSSWLGNLRSLKLSGLRLYATLTNRKDKVENLALSIASYWPGLQDLAWCGQTLTVHQLSLFASHFPKLKSFQFDGMNPPDSLANVGGTPLASRSHLTLRFHFGSLSQPELDILARCLANLRCGIQYENTRAGGDVTMERWLNARIREYAQ